MINTYLDIEISAEKLLQIDKESYLLIDVREQWEKDVADIGGVLVPFRSLPTIEEKHELKSQRLILFCHHGIRSLYAAEYLRSKSFTLAQSMKGGIDYWSRNIDHKIPTY